LAILDTALVTLAVGYIALRAYHQMRNVLPLYTVNRS